MNGNMSTARKLTNLASVGITGPTASAIVAGQPIPKSSAPAPTPTLVQTPAEEVIGAGPNAGLTPSQVEAGYGMKVDTSETPLFKAGSTKEEILNTPFLLNNFSGGGSSSASVSSSSTPTSINRPIYGAQNSLEKANTAGSTTTTKDGRTQAEKDAEEYLNVFVKPKTEEEIIAEKTAAAAGLISSTKDYYAGLLSDRAKVNEQNTAETNAQSVLSGLMGSSEAGNRAKDTGEKNLQANKRIMEEQALKLSGIYTDISNSARTELTAQKADARASATDILARKEKNQAKAVEDVKLLASSGFDLSSIRTKDPITYQHLVDSVGGEDKLNALFVTSRPKNDLVGSPVRIGDHYVQMYKNPLTGAISTEEIKLPFDLPQNYSKFEKIGDTLVAIPDNWNGDMSQIKKIGGEVVPSTGVTGKNGAQYAAILSTILGSGKFTKDQVKLVTNSINNGEDPFTVIKNQAKNIMGQTEATTVTKFETAKSALQDIQNSLAEFYKANGKTNIFSGNYEKVINKLGEVNDPALVDLATQIQASLQIYRNAVSGTAYSAQEGADINTIFPGINKSQGLNEAILKGRMKAFDSTIDGTYRSAIGTSYDKLKEAETKSSEAPVIPPAPAGMVNIRKPDGTTGAIPAANLPAALKLGATQI